MKSLIHKQRKEKQLFSLFVQQFSSLLKKVSAQTKKASRQDTRNESGHKDFPGETVTIYQNTRQMPLKEGVIPPGDL